MKETFQNKIVSFLYFLEGIKAGIFRFLKKNLKYILPVLAIGLILIPEIILGILAMIGFAILSLYVAKKALMYLIATGLFVFNSFISICGFFLCLGIILWILQLLDWL